MEHPQKKSSPPLPDPSNNKPHRTRIIIHNTALQSEDRVEATKKVFGKMSLSVALCILKMMVQCGWEI